ncbi:hypothetical protein [Natrialba taiwanensis]|uniref:Uncharacterized protein n=1 Tax=Natrialba taiwanensis DSM 12281 TaxID=1230458 RepID=L9ZSU5_9EURY|nr:hypothetical protein [Natrialba taiwanensis]ELY89444.1 hypothetical protein C484_14165 [Natrialba taiwanensis DSM 12281]
MVSDRSRSLSRRTALHGLAVLAGTTLGGLGTGTVGGARPPDTTETPADTERYVAVVDRIVDGEHVVLLLEEDGQIVDQLVVSRSEFDTVAESDILVVIVADDELIDYRILPERPCRESEAPGEDADPEAALRSHAGTRSDATRDCL